MEPEKTPKEIYQDLIDELVKGSNPISSKLILSESIFSRAKDELDFNTFVSNLNEEQKVLLAEMMKKERQSAIHDVLACLTWQIECNEVTLNYKQQEMLTSLSDQGMHGDYIGRLTDWEWPKD